MLLLLHVLVFVSEACTYPKKGRFFHQQKQNVTWVFDVWLKTKNNKKKQLGKKISIKTHKQTQLVGGFNPFEKC